MKQGILSKINIAHEGILKKMNTRLLGWSWYHCRFWFAMTSGLKFERASSRDLPPQRQALFTWDFNFCKLLLRSTPLLPSSLWQRLCPPGPIGDICNASPAALNALPEKCCRTLIGDEGLSSWGSASPFESMLIGTYLMFSIFSSPINRSLHSIALQPPFWIIPPNFTILPHTHSDEKTPDGNYHQNYFRDPPFSRQKRFLTRFNEQRII